MWEKPISNGRPLQHAPKSKIDLPAESIRSVYVGFEQFAQELRTELELAHISYQEMGSLLYSTEPPITCAWAKNIWQNPLVLPIHSIRHASQSLRNIQRNWCLESVTEHRRAKLIQEQLPKVPAKPFVFPATPPNSPMGSWCLLEKNIVLASPACSSPFPHGDISFVENKQAPPNRAYLKLWEALLRIQHWPKPKERCLDLGSSPGGWTWALQQLGAEVISVDKAPLEPSIAALPGIQYRKQDAFRLNPADLGPLDWFFSDVICYPEDLLELIQHWLAAKTCKNFVCTIKFQGKTNHEIVKKFIEIPSSFVQHLNNNKHELTWICLDVKTN